MGKIEYEKVDEIKKYKGCQEKTLDTIWYFV